MRYLFVLIAMSALMMGAASRAIAGEWGCEVLLCAASSTPSWRGVQACHPPMERLLSAMKRPGFSWPICPEAGAGKPGYDAYLECPAGWTPTSSRGGSGEASSADRSRCMRQVTNCHGGGSTRSGRSEAALGSAARIYSSDDQCSYTEYQDRLLRAEPYFFDIRDDATGKTVRHWFSLSK